MTTWTLRLKQNAEESIDASPIRMENFAGKTVREIQQVRLQTHSVSDFFDVEVDVSSGDIDRIVMLGDLTSFHHIGACQSRGELWIEGDAGDFLGAAIGGKRVGMSGGRIVVTGNAGDYAGHRMRRGEIWVGGNAGRLLGAGMIAGTIAVVGQLSVDPAIGMRRGSLFVSRLPALTEGRFTEPVESEYLFASLVNSPKNKIFETFWRRFQKQFRENSVVSRRGDRAVGGQGEIVAPMVD